MTILSVDSAKPTTMYSSSSWSNLDSPPAGRGWGRGASYASIPKKKILRGLKARAHK